ncbi:MAG: hypothetical protein HYX53_04400 [Chloroflexi bacterium]|nr:hypothetical protein [Chloroflexota bacterium]
MDGEADLSLVLWSTDIPGLVRFLERVAGVAVEAMHPGYAALRLGDSRLIVHGDEAYRGHPWYTALAREGVARGIGAEIRLRVDDASAAFSHALAMGGLSIQPPNEVEGTIECQVMGPDGFLMALWAPAPVPAR